MPEDVKSKLEQIIDRLKPSDLFNRARAIVINRMPGGGGWDFADGEDDEGEPSKAYEKADKMAQEIGRWLASDAATRAEFFPELLVQPLAMRAFECGRGLAEGANDLNAMWLELAIAYGAIEPETRNAAALGGFIREAYQRDPGFTSAALETAMENPDLAPVLPYLQARAGIDVEGIARLRRAIAKGVLMAANFRHIANGSVSNSPPEQLAELLEDIATLSGGVEMALRVLHMHFFRARDDTREQSGRIVAVGRDLLARASFGKDSDLGDFGANTVIRICLAGDEGRRSAEKVCDNICAALDAYGLSPHNLSHTFKALFETQPFVTLDAFLLLPSPHGTPHGIRHRFDLDFAIGPSLEAVEPATLEEWASRDPEVRYPLLGQCLRMFRKQGNEEQNDISPLFLSMLNHAPDKRLFLGDPSDRVHPRSGGGSFVHALIQRKAQVMKLAEHPDPQVRTWVSEVTPQLDRWVEYWRERDREREESFE